jgi:hypothetical protein
MRVGGQRNDLATLPQERTGTHCIGGWVGLRAGLDGIRSQTVQPLEIRYTDCTVPTPFELQLNIRGHN